MIVIVVKCRKWFAIFIKYGMKIVFSGNKGENADVFCFPLPCMLGPLPRSFHETTEESTYSTSTPEIEGILLVQKKTRCRDLCLEREKGQNTGST